MTDLLSWFSDAKRRRPLLRLLVGAQVLYVLGVAGAGYATTALGRQVVLTTAPIDPRDLLSGDFVRLHYTVGTVALGQWHDAAAPRRRQAVFVLLAPGPDSLSTAVGVYPQAPTPDAGQAILRGWVTDVYRNSLNLRFNLERYYVPDGHDLRREQAGRLHPLRVRVSIAPWGQARIVRVDTDKKETPKPSR